MLKNIIYLSGFIFIMLSSSCDAFQDFTLEQPGKVPLVVEGILVPGMEPAVWLSKLSETGNIDDTTYIPVTNAQVRLYHNGLSYNLKLINADCGEYTYEGTDLDIRAGDLYSLEVDYMDRIVSAETDIPYAVQNISVVSQMSVARDTVTVLNISWDIKDDSYFYLFLESDTANTSEPICYYSEYPFAENYYTIDASGLTEGDTYYLIIYSLTHNYAQYYFGYDPLNSNYDYESNVTDAYGIFTGLNVNYISFVYQKDMNIKLQPQIAPDYLFQKIINVIP